MCAFASDNIYLSGFGPKCSSTATYYGGFDDVISMDNSFWVSHCEDSPLCETATNDCTLKRVGDNNCITFYQYDDLGLPRRCYRTSSIGMCVAPIDSSITRVPWCAGFPQ